MSQMSRANYYSYANVGLKFGLVEVGFGVSWNHQDNILALRTEELLSRVLNLETRLAIVEDDYSRLLNAVKESPERVQAILQEADTHRQSHHCDVGVLNLGDSWLAGQVSWRSSTDSFGRNFPNIENLFASPLIDWHPNYNAVSKLRSDDSFGNGDSWNQNWDFDVELNTTHTPDLISDAIEPRTPPVIEPPKSDPIREYHRWCLRCNKVSVSWTEICIYCGAYIGHSSYVPR